MVQKGHVIERVRTGIEGFDELIEGGLPQGRIYLVAGETGTCKTTFALQFLYMGARYFGESGIFVTIDEKPERIIEDAASIGWDLEELIDKNKLLILEISPFFSDIKEISAKRIAEELKLHINQLNAKRLAIDPIAPLVLKEDEGGVTTQNIIRMYLKELFDSLEELKITTVATSEIPTGTNMLSRYGVEEFLASGVIVLRLIREGTTFSRELYVRKMRGVNHSLNAYPFVIQRGRGIVISI